MLVAKQLNITRPDDWYNVSAIQMAKLKSSALFARHGGLVGILKKVYPGTLFIYLDRNC